MRAKVLLWCVMAGAAAVGALGQDDDHRNDRQTNDIVYLNAEEERITCVVPFAATVHKEPNDTQPHPLNPPRKCASIDRGQRFLVQGRRAQLRVVNRKFFTDYSFNIDGVTQLKQIAIQDLEEAANLQTPVTSTVGAAPKGVAPKGLTTGGQLPLRTAHDFLAELVDEGRASNPANELESDALVVEREEQRALGDVQIMDEAWEIIHGNDRMRDCGANLGAPDILSAEHCLEKTFEKETTGEWGRWNGPYGDQDKFARLMVEIGDRITMTKALGSALQQYGSALSTQLPSLESDLAQLRADLNALVGNITAAQDAITAYHSLAELDGNNALPSLRRAQIKLRLMQDLAGAASPGKAVLDDAELNRLVEEYVNHSNQFSGEITGGRRNDLQRAITSARSTQNDATRKVESDKQGLDRNQSRVNQELAAGINQINVDQSRMLARANQIYDHSAVPEPLDKWIDLSKNSGNLLVYYTVRRVDVFPRYTVPVVTLQGAAPSIPPVAPAAPAAPAATPAPATGGDTSTGTVVAHGSLEVHDFYRATVVAGFTFSTIKDQSVKSKAVTTGTATDGTACSTTTPCSQPFLDKGSPIPAVVVGVNYYLSRHGHDTFPGAKRGIGQKMGIFGGLAANRVNSYFLGLGFEPSEAIQLTGGVNFVLQDSISGAYSASLAYAGTPSFGGRNVWLKGAYLGAGFNLSIFRKIFGSVTGLGTKASGGGS